MKEIWDEGILGREIGGHVGMNRLIKSGSDEGDKIDYGED